MVLLPKSSDYVPHPLRYLLCENVQCNLKIDLLIRLDLHARNKSGLYQNLTLNNQNRNYL